MFSSFFLRHKHLLSFKLLFRINWEPQLSVSTKYLGHSPKAACIWWSSGFKNKYRTQESTKEIFSSQTSSHQLQESTLTPSSTDWFAWLVLVMWLIKLQREDIPQHPGSSASPNNYFHLAESRRVDTPKHTLIQVIFRVQGTACRNYKKSQLCLCHPDNSSTITQPILDPCRDTF